MMRCTVDQFRTIACLLITSLLMAFAQEIPGNSSGQLAKDLYLVAVTELQVQLSQSTTVDSVCLGLAKDAEDFADAERWADAYALAITALDLLDFQNPPLQRVAASNIEPGYQSFSEPAASTNLQIETGLDYSQQEFETSFLEGDSVFFEQLRSPFFGFNYRHPLGPATATLDHRVRFDQHFLNYSLTGRLDRGTISSQRNVEVEGGFFHSPTEDQQSFIESRAALSFSGGRYGSRRWRVEADSRFKYYPGQDSLRGHIMTAGATMGLDMALTPVSSFFTTVWPRYYREFRDSGYRYWEVRGQAGWRHLQVIRMRREISATIVYNRFLSGFSPGGQENYFLELLPQINWNWSLTKNLGFELEGNVQFRRHRDANDVTPDFFLQSVVLMPEFYLNDFTTIGAGFVHEGRQHSTPFNDNFSAQADYRSIGGILHFDWTTLTGAFLSASYQLSQRNYPNAVVSVFDSFYSDRLTHSISLFGWLPINQQWRVQLLVNYDNEQDRQFEQNDIRSTLLNAGIIYQY